MLATVAIINYRTGGLTVDCLASLEPEIARFEETIHVRVVDNDSGDDSPDQIEQAIAERSWGDWCSLVRLPKNGGFAYGNNEAIRPFVDSGDPPRYVWLLNPDTVVRPNALVELVRFLDAHPDVGIAGSRLEDPDGTPQRSAFRFPGVLSEFEAGTRLGPITKLLRRFAIAPPVPVGDEPQPADWMAGASLLVRREVFDQVGYMDEAYFMYFEEVAFCRETMRAGFERWYVPKSRVVHLVGQASGISGKVTKRMPTYWFDSRRRYFLTQLGTLRATLADAAWLTGFGLWRLRRRFQRKDDHDPQHLLADSFRHSVFRRGWRVSA
ncbi:MAG: glycosyltransferase family 2 protein [Planctomycetota bacterium]